MNYNLQRKDDGLQQSRTSCTTQQMECTQEIKL